MRFMFKKAYEIYKKCMANESIVPKPTECELELAKSKKKDDKKDGDKKDDKDDDKSL